jgi:hypothetical protein
LYDIDSKDYPKAISNFINNFNNSILEIPNEIHNSAPTKNSVKALIDEIVETKNIKKIFLDYISSVLFFTQSFFLILLKKILQKK